jgi:hypothetical protein
MRRSCGDEIRQAVGIDPQALIADEAAYLIGFRNADELRNRRANETSARM